MDDETFDKWMDYHFTICERQDLIRVINDPALTEFQYLVDGDKWTVSIK